MPLLNLVVVIIVIGVLMWAVNSYIPMDARIKNLLNVVVVIALVVYVLAAFGLFDALRGISVPRVD